MNADERRLERQEGVPADFGGCFSGGSVSLWAVCWVRLGQGRGASEFAEDHDGEEGGEVEDRGEEEAAGVAAGAVERELDAEGEDFLFFVNAESRRGNVVYRRYDGHYGLLTPE